MNEEEFSKFRANIAEVGSMRDDKSDRSPPEPAADQTDESTDLKQLFALSNSIKDILVPVRALSFKVSLGQRLEKRRQERSRFQLFATRQNVVLMAVAGAGSLLSIAGVVLLVLRKVKTSGKADRTTATAPI